MAGALLHSNTNLPWRSTTRADGSGTPSSLLVREQSTWIHEENGAVFIPLSITCYILFQPKENSQSLKKKKKVIMIWGIRGRIWNTLCFGLSFPYARGWQTMTQGPKHSHPDPFMNCPLISSQQWSWTLSQRQYGCKASNIYSLVLCRRICWSLDVEMYAYMKVDIVRV